MQEPKLSPLVCPVYLHSAPPYSSHILDGAPPCGPQQLCCGVKGLIWCQKKSHPSGLNHVPDTAAKLAYRPLSQASQRPYPKRPAWVVLAYLQHNFCRHVHTLFCCSGECNFRLQKQPASCCVLSAPSVVAHIDTTSSITALVWPTVKSDVSDLRSCCCCHAVLVRSCWFCMSPITFYAALLLIPYS